MGLKKIFKANLLNVLSSSVLIFVVLFFFTNTNEMMKSVYTKGKTSVLLDQNEILLKYFSISLPKLMVYYIVCGIVVSIFLRKKETFLNILNDINKEVGVVFKYLFMLLSGAISIFLLAIVKLILNRQAVHKIGHAVWINSKIIWTYFFVYLTITLLILSFIWFFSMIFKEQILAVILPPIFLEILFLTFGLNSELFHLKFKFLKGVTSTLDNGRFYDSVYLFYHDFRIEQMSSSNQVWLGVLFIFLFLGFTVGSYFINNKLNEERLNSVYFFEWSKKLVHIVVILFFSEFIALACGAVVAFMIPDHDLEDGMFWFSSIYITILLILTVSYLVVWGYKKYKKKRIKDNAV